MDVAAVNQFEVFNGAVIEQAALDGFSLDDFGFVSNGGGGIGDNGGVEAFPFRVGQGVVVEFLELGAQVVFEVIAAGDGQVVVGLTLQDFDEVVFKLGFALVGQFPGVIGGRLRGNGVLIGEHDGGDGGCRIMDDCHGEVFRRRSRWGGACLV